MFTLTGLSLKFPNNLRMFINTQITKIPRFQWLWFKMNIIFDTTKYCEDWVINTVFKVLKHLFLKLSFHCQITSGSLLNKSHTTVIVEAIMFG